METEIEKKIEIEIETKYLDPIHQHYTVLLNN